MCSTRMLFAFALLSATIFPAVQVQATMIDVTAVGAVQTDGTAVFKQYNGDQEAGSGNLDSFLRIQGKDTESGYNTGDKKVEFDTKKGNFTHSVMLSSIPIVTMNGVAYREFLLDTNESNGSGAALLSLDAIKLYTADSDNYSTGFGTPVYDLGGNYVAINDGLSSGSGQGDMLMYVPSSLFGSDENKFVYLFCTFGNHYASDGGYEEWAVGAGGVSFVPEPATLALLALGGLALLRRKRQRASRHEVARADH